MRLKNILLIGLIIFVIGIIYGKTYTLTGKDSVVRVLKINNYNGSVEKWCNDLLGEQVVLNKKVCQVGQQKIVKYKIKEKKDYNENNHVKVIDYLTDDDNKLTLKLSDGNGIYIGNYNKKIKSKQSTHKVTFVDYDNTILKEEVVLHGNNAIPPIVGERKNYRFVKWNKSYNNVNSDLMVKALYKEDDTVTKIYVSDVIAKPGQVNVKVPVNIKNNVGILGMTLLVHYNDKKLKLTDIKNGQLLKGVLAFTRAGKLCDGCICTWDGQKLSDANVMDGEIAELIFDIPETATSGEYQIKINYMEGDVVDKNLLSLAPLIANGKIIVRN